MTRLAPVIATRQPRSPPTPGNTLPYLRRQLFWHANISDGHIAYCLSSVGGWSAKKMELRVSQNVTEVMVLPRS